MKSLRRSIPSAAIAVLASIAVSAQAQTTDAERIRNLEKLVEQLSQKLSQIEQSNAGARDAQTKVAQQAAKIEAIERNVSDIGGSLARRTTDSLPVHGFADVGMVKNSEDNITTKGRKGMTVGSFDLYLTPQFSDRAKGLIELVFEANAAGEIATDLERVQFGYLFNDAATGWVGRFHTPYGYWNTAFHHGQQIQTAVTRPRFLDFEDKGGILPAHTTGAWLTGAINAGSGKLGYDVYVGNAPRIAGTAAGSALSGAHPGGFSTAVNAGTYAGSGTLSMVQSGNTSNENSVGFNAWYQPGAVSGLRLGLHGLRAQVRDNLTNTTRLNMFGGYVAYTDDPWEVLGEYYRFRNIDRSGGTGTHASWAGYTQVGYNIGQWTPYGRVERTALDQTDNYFGVQASGRSYKRLSTGVRYDLDPKAALKAEFASTRKEDLGPGVVNRYPELRLEYSVGF